METAGRETGAREQPGQGEKSMTDDKKGLSIIRECRRRGLSAQEMTREALARAEEKGGKDALNCIAETDATAMDQARALDEAGDRSAPLFGIPVLVKDNIDVKGLHTTAGSLALEDNIAREDAPVIRNLRRNGAVILGKTNMTEFANFTTAGMPGGYSSRGGQVIHAIDPSVSPLGSSSGSGVAVSAGIVPLAVGTDTSFSVIACAQANGICGLKPPAGTLSADGIIPIARTLDSAGAMTTCFEDALEMYSAMRDEPFGPVAPADAGAMRIAVNTANRDMVSSGQMEALGELLRGLKERGARVDEISQPFVESMKVIMQWEFREQLEDYLRSSAARRKTLREIVEFYEADPDVMMKYGDTLLRRALDETPGGTKGQPYLEAMELRGNMIPRVRNEIGEYDAVIMTGPTSILHFCGLPSVTVASDRKNDHGVRRGFILYGADEARLYAAALAIEQICR